LIVVITDSSKDVYGKTSRRCLDDLGLVAGLLDLDVQRDPVRAEIEDGVEERRLVPAQPDQRRVGEHRDGDPTSRRVVMHDEFAIRRPAHVQLHRVSAEGDRGLERGWGVFRGFA
jgi:hypothetical protein